jgi:uncharacterized protein YqhQ
METTLRLGGMALANGVLVHGRRAWACAVRARSGEIAVAAGRKPRLGGERPLVRGPIRLAEALLLLPTVRRRLPEARFAFERPAVLAAMTVASVVARILRGRRPAPFSRELAASLVALAPALLALRQGEVAAYHGAEHVAIGRYEAGGVAAAKEHPRCGTHLVGPLLAASAGAAALAGRLPPRLRRPAGALAAAAAVAVATEVLVWMERHPERLAARLLAWPGYELQRRLATAEPSPAQVEVAEMALRTCLQLEQAV